MGPKNGLLCLFAHEVADKVIWMGPSFLERALKDLVISQNLFFGLHLRPSQTIDAFVTLGAQKGIACHMGTFQLGDDSPQEAIEELKIAMSSCCVSQERFIIPHYGCTMRV